MIHLLNPLWNAWGGSERRTLALHDLLRPHAERRRGYAAHVRQGLFDTEAEGVELLLSLKADPARRAAWGEEGRRTARALYGPAWRAATAAYYLRGARSRLP